ncbi:hypothetical protein PCL_06678 [Purpureocillium lilacinum]|uniref:Cyanovirin-N domain-containing protein n=1 Tax=Purpureocillium lilacinum TaxID=33203 RepID=A0A2U3DTX7_PURLI|nr:hypothetical protein PCL_06678 [Purpureocillium lilacinum]
MLFHLVALAAVSSATALPPHYTSDSSAVAPNTTTLDKRDCVPYKNTCAGPSFLRIDDRHAHLTISRCRESHEHSPLISSSVDLNDCLAAASGHLVPGRGFLADCRDLRYSHTMFYANCRYAYEDNALTERAVRIDLNSIICSRGGVLECY